MQIARAGEWWTESSHETTDSKIFIERAMKRTTHVTDLVRCAILALTITASVVATAVGQMTPARAIGADRLAWDYDVTGKGIGVAVFEAGGRPNFAHPRLKMGTGAAFMVQKTPNVSMADHPCGVVGVIGANDIGAPGRGGIARGSTIYNYSRSAGEKNLEAFFVGFFTEWFNNDGSLWKISNHSYGADGHAGWRWDDSWKRWTWYGDVRSQARYGLGTQDPKFGWYGPLAEQIDHFTSLNKDQITVFSAGNYRGKGPDPSSAPLTYNNDGPGGMTVSADQTLFPPINGGPLGYDCMEGFKVAKNAITVGSVHYDNNTKGWSLSSFSSTGPTDDGRIKPDVVAFGDSVNVLRRTDDTISYGTSFAAPAVTGVLAQLAELWKRTDAVPMRSATARVVLCHTAREMGNPGPDYRYGWGKVDAKAAGVLVSSRSDNRFNLQERSLRNGRRDTIYIQTVEEKEVKVTIAWTDPAGVSIPVDNNGVPPLNNRTRMLQNDLDLRVYPITGENDETAGVPKLPWELDPSKPTLNAVRKNNSVDNIEQVTLISDKVFAPKSSGIYMIVVRHEGTLKDRFGATGASNSQDYSIAISGAWEYLPIPRSIVASQTGESSSRATWRSVPNSTGYEIEYRAVGDVNWISKGIVGTTEATFNNLQSGTWQMRVRSRRNSYMGTWSSPVAFIIGKPKAPTGLNMTGLTATSAVLRWSAVAGAAGYEVAYAPVRSDGTILTDDFEYRSVTDTKLALSGLPPDEYIAWFVRTRVAPMGASEWAQATRFATPTNCASYEPDNDEFATARVARIGEYFTGRICRNDKADRYRIERFEFPDDRYLLLTFDKHGQPYSARLYRHDRQSGGFDVSLVANTNIILSPTEQRSIYYTNLDHSRYDYWLEIESPSPAVVYSDFERYGFWVESSSTPFGAERRDGDGDPSMSLKQDDGNPGPVRPGRVIIEQTVIGMARQQ
jgi:hypothetical protein